MNGAPVRPRPLTDVIADAFTLCARHWRPLWALALVSVVPLLLAQVLIAIGLAAFGPSTLTVNTKLSGGQTLFLASAVLLLAMVIFVGVSSIVPLTFETALARPPRVRPVLRALPARLPGMLLAGLSMALLVTLLETIIFAPIAIFMAVRWCFAPQTLWQRHQGGVAALRDSFQLVRGQWLHVLLSMGAALLLSTLPVFVLRPIANVSGALPVVVAISVLTWLLAAPFLAQAGTLLYLDALARKGERLPSPDEEALR